MDESIFIDLHNKAEDFGSIERLVSESSKLRKKHSEESISLIKQSLEIGDILNHEFEIISRANKTMRDQHSAILNYCNVLDSNTARQKEIFGALKDNAFVSHDTLGQVEEMVRSLSDSLHKAIILLHMIIENDNEIILMDNLIISRKKFQRDSIDRLKKLAFRTLEDAESAIRGSSSNLKRGLQLAEGLAGVERHLSDKNREELSRLIGEANTGWNIAAAVNRSSATQVLFAEQVGEFTARLHEDSEAIRDLVVDKHGLFSRNRELARELTVILSLEIKDYLPAGELANKVCSETDLPAGIRRLADNLVSYAAIACRDILFVSNLNFDMTDSISLNADIEKKSVDLTRTELEYFERIRQEVQSMTEATKYPIEGSERNIENGKIIEGYLKKIMEGMG
ncbi:MAG: hypothetical protein KA369_08985 [Spirochaetes bacterium]|nr:hypothetical protein [Spirochaetota bacterium]